MPTDAEQRFIQAWRFAAPELEKIQRRELRELDDSAGLRMIGAPPNEECPYSGLIEFQSWMMRMRVIELRKRLPPHESSTVKFK
jgi:hypothetical protein